MNISKDDLISAIDGISDKYIVESAFIDKSRIETEDNDSYIQLKPHKKRRTVKRILLFAAVISIITVLFAIMPATSNDNMEINIRPEIVDVTTVKIKRGIDIFGLSITIFDEMRPQLKFYENEMKLIPEKYSSSEYELIRTLNEEGIQDVLLPEDMLTDRWKVENYEVLYKDEISLMPEIELSCESGNCTVQIRHTPICEDSATTVDGKLGVTKAESLIVNGIDVILTQYGDGNSIYMEYQTVIPVGDTHETRTEYAFSFDKTFTFEQVLEIAKSLS